MFRVENEPGASTQVFPSLAKLHASTPASQLRVVASNLAALSPTPEDQVRAYVRERKERGVLPFDVFYDQTRSITIGAVTSSPSPNLSCRY